MTTKPTVLITGASSGIGVAYAERFARRGHDVVLVARDAARLEAVADRIGRASGVRAEVLAADLTRESDLGRVEARLRQDTAIGVLVNNAGVLGQGTFLTQDSLDISGLIALNVTALARLANAIAPRLATAGAGAIVNIASVVGLAPELGLSVYGATKAFVLFLSQGLQGELGKQGVYVQAVLPSVTRTELWERAGRNVDDLPAAMTTGDLVDAALVGFDRRETVTIPPLPDDAQWVAFEAARQAMLPNFMRADAAARYQTAA